MRLSLVVILFTMLITASCSIKSRVNKTVASNEIEAGISREVCDSIFPIKSLIIKNIKTILTIDEEVYDAKVSIYYIPDSILYLSAVNTGFEILRIGVLKDSSIYINRVDKTVIVFRYNELDYPAPAEFYDLEYLINKKVVCDSIEKVKMREGYAFLDISVKDIAKKLFYKSSDLTIEKFEFFHNKTGEYFIGERTEANTFSIYTNFILDDLSVETIGGDLEYGKEINVNLGFNSKKYTVKYY